RLPEASISAGCSSAVLPVHPARSRELSRAKRQRKSWRQKWFHILRRCPGECLARCELVDRLAGLVGDGSPGIEADRFFKFGFGAGRILEFLVGQAEMIAISLVVGHGFHSRFEQWCGSRVRAGTIVRPAERVGGVWQVRQPFSPSLSEAQRNVDVAAVF